MARRIPPLRPLSVRASGILLHPTSLPGGHGIGDLGRAASRFVRFLRASGQSWWQMLPVGPPDDVGSPYRTLSAFAGSPLLISLDLLVKDGWLAPDDIAPGRTLNANRVDYGAVARFKYPKLWRAFGRLPRMGPRHGRQFKAFCEQRRSWLDDYALFRALKEAHQGAAWTRWDPGLRSRAPAALARAARRLREPIRYEQFLQYVFWQQWGALRHDARTCQVGFIGDLPMFVAHDSADVWADQDLFRLDRLGTPEVIAGVPPDYFSPTGQVWDNPVYRWARLRRTGYAWWLARLRMMLERFDAVRLDHFIGFHRSWVVPAGARSAQTGRYLPGPGAHVFHAMRRALGDVQVIAEDLGVLTPEVKALRDACGFPGMRVLQFAFGDDPEAGTYQPHNYPTRCVVYTGTHDNDTTVGWFRDRGSSASTRSKAAIRRERSVVLQYLGSDGRAIHWAMIRLAFSSVADLAIIPAQDLLGLGSAARMNLPGTVGRNWQWRLADGALDRRLERRLRRLTERCGRIPRPEPPSRVGTQD